MKMGKAHKNTFLNIPAIYCNRYNRIQGFLKQEYCQSNSTGEERNKNGKKKMRRGEMREKKLRNYDVVES
jgi:hypothetical protein